MNLGILSNYVSVITLALCLAIGYIIKNSIDVIPNKYIPAIMGVIGALFNIWVCATFTPEVLLTGLCSGLAATGAFELVRNVKNNDYK